MVEYTEGNTKEVCETKNISIEKVFYFVPLLFWGFTIIYKIVETNSSFNVK